MEYLFLLDTKTCIGCGACAVACMDQNDIAPQLGDMPFRKCFTVEHGSSNDARVDYISMGCMHCEDAPCIEGCPSGCLTKDPETGFTVYDNTNCIGCHSCAMACPYAAPCFNTVGKMVKCDGCVERVHHGMKPACVRVCPYKALKLLSREEYNAMEKEKATKRVLSSVVFDR